MADVVFNAGLPADIQEQRRKAAMYADLAQAMQSSYARPMQINPQGAAHWTQALAKALEGGIAGVSRGMAMGGEAKADAAEKQYNDIAKHKLMQSFMPPSVEMEGGQTAINIPSETINTPGPFGGQIKLAGLQQQPIEGQRVQPSLGGFSGPEIAAMIDGMSAKEATQTLAPMRAGDIKYQQTRNDALADALAERAFKKEETAAEQAFRKQLQGEQISAQERINRDDNAAAERRARIEASAKARASGVDPVLQRQIMKAQVDEFVKTNGLSRGAEIKQSIGKINKALDLLESGNVPSGSLGGAQKWMGGALESLGFGGDLVAAAQNGELKNSMLAGPVLEMLKTMKPASNLDAEYVQKMLGSGETVTKQGMLNILREFRSGLHNQGLSYNDQVSRINSDLQQMGIRPLSASMYDTKGIVRGGGGKPKTNPAIDALINKYGD